MLPGACLIVFTQLFRYFLPTVFSLRRGRRAYLHGAYLVLYLVLLILIVVISRVRAARVDPPSLCCARFRRALLRYFFLHLHILYYILYYCRNRIAPPTMYIVIQRKSYLPRHHLGVKSNNTLPLEVDAQKV